MLGILLLATGGGLGETLTLTPLIPLFPRPPLPIVPPPTIPLGLILPACITYALADANVSAHAILIRLFTYSRSS